MTDQRKQLATKLLSPDWQDITQKERRRIADLLDQPQPECGITVRIAVAMAHDGDAIAQGVFGDDDEGAFNSVADAYPIRLGIVTAVLPPPVVPVVAGEVERS